MPWKGITDNQADVGDAQRIVENASYFTKGELRRRLGIGARVPQGGNVVTEQGSYLLYVDGSGNIVSSDGTTSSTLLSGYNVVNRPNVQQAFGRTYFTNDFDAIRVSDDGVTIRTAGITAPVTAPSAPSQAAGNCDIGTHLLRYRWYDSRRMRYSNPSDAISVSVSSSTKQLTITNVTSADSTVDTIVWELTPAAQGTYYQALTTTNAAGTSVVSISDANLVNKTPSATFGDFGHNPPPIASLICEHQTYIFLWGASTRTFTGCGVTSGSPTITGTGFSTQWAGRQVTVAGSTTTYYVSSATTTTITLTANYAGTTSASATITVASGAPDLLAWSQPGQAESFDTTALARRIPMAAGDAPSAMLSLHGDLYLISQRAMRRLNFTNDPGGAPLLAVPSTLGAYHQRCVMTDAGNMAFGWGRNGIWKISAMYPERISDPILTTVGAIMDATRITERFCVWEPTERVALFFFCLTGDTACKAAAAYYVDAEAWQIWKFRQPMTAGCINANYTDRTRLLLVDSNASSWRYGVNVNDGIDNGSIQAGASSTTTVIQSATANVGQVLYRPLTGEERYVQAAGASTITLSSALATAPTAGEALYLGSIRQRIVTEWSIGMGLADKKRPRYLLLAGHPTSTNGMGSVKVYMYADFAASAMTVSGTSSDQWPYGVTPASGLNYVTVNLDLAWINGFVSIPIFSNWARSISAEIIAEQPLDQLRWLDVTLSPNDRPEEARVEGE